MTAPVRFTFTDAVRRHGHLEVAEFQRMEDAYPSFLGTCVLADGEFCHTFADYAHRPSLEERWVEHAAGVLGICWACSQPEEGRPNRDDCDRCWLMRCADQGIWPRDAPERPGAGR